MEVPAGLGLAYLGLMANTCDRKIKLQEGFFNDGTLPPRRLQKIQRRGGTSRSRANCSILWRPLHLRDVPQLRRVLCCGGVVASLPSRSRPIRTRFELKIDQLRKVGAKTVVMAAPTAACNHGLRAHFNLDVKWLGLSRWLPTR
jgi:hypothetical protein